MDWWVVDTVLCSKNWGVNAILWMYDLHVHVHVYHIHVHQNFCYLQTIFTNYPSFKKTMKRIIIIIKNIFNKNGRCREVKTQKVCEQGWEVNLGLKIKQTTSI